MHVQLIDRLHNTLIMFTRAAGGVLRMYLSCLLSPAEGAH
jgi:hypothetical protein